MIVSTIEELAICILVSFLVLFWITFLTLCKVNKLTTFLDEMQAKAAEVIDEDE